MTAQLSRAEAEKILLAQDVDDLEVVAEACKASLAFYTETFWPVLEPGRELITGWVLDAIDEHLLAVSSGELRKLLITVPPGSMKSLKTRVFWSTWEWTHRPSMRYLGFSYAEALATRDNRRSRMILEDPLYQKLFPDVRLSIDQAAKTDFANTKTGFMKAAGVGGKATGERGDRVIIDDPHNVKEGESEAKRAEALMWFREVIPSRVNDPRKDAFIIIQQRVHYDDVAQAAIELGYEHLNIPAEFDIGNPCSTSIGWTDPRTEDLENYWPARYPPEELEYMKTALGDYAYSAQYNQSPTPREGGLFKIGKLRYIDEEPDDPDIVWADGWDLAGTDEKENRDSAYTARVKMGYRPSKGRFVISYVDRRRASPGAVERWLEDVRDDLALLPYKVTMVLPQDPGQAGKAQKRTLAKLLAGASFIFELQSGDKETRASPFAAQVENGNVDIVKGPWNKEFVEELRQFPRGKYKDQVDAASSAFNRVAPVRRRRSTPGALSSRVANRADANNSGS